MEGEGFHPSQAVTLIRKNSEAIDSLESQQGFQNDLLFAHLLFAMESHQLIGDGARNSAQHCPAISQAEGKSAEDVRMLGHPIGHSEKLPHRTSAQVVVSLSVNEQSRNSATASSSQAPVVEEGLL